MANKTDDVSMDTMADVFYKLGRGRIVKVSAQQHRGRQELLNLIVDRLPKETDDEATGEQAA